jgi:hypothetical protein
VRIKGFTALLSPLLSSMPTAFFRDELCYLCFDMLQWSNC